MGCEALPYHGVDHPLHGGVTGDLSRGSVALRADLVRVWRLARQCETAKRQLSRLENYVAAPENRPVVAQPTAVGVGIADRAQIPDHRFTFAATATQRNRIRGELPGGTAHN
ncbi:MAG: hypothetical protein ACRDTA_19165 [Pseudonocardiaceae bacterium]